MKNFLKGFILITIIMGITFLMPGLMDSTEYSIQAGEADWYEETGEEVDPFTVVEIVPYKGMAEIGYLVGGQEPVDQELMTFSEASYLFNFLSDGGANSAISVYRSYTEKPLTIPGVADTDWWMAYTQINQAGFLEPANDSSARYRLENGDNYVHVANGGSYVATMAANAKMEKVYTSDVLLPTNKKNVKAYFVYGNTSGASLYHITDGYEPYSVTENPTHKGDYDYNSSTKRFFLNMGSGKYDVLFVPSTGANLYYMLNNYQIVADLSGVYSFPITYVASPGGNYIRESGTRYVFDPDLGTHKWTASNTALTKTNYSTEGTKTWVHNQKVSTPFQYTYRTQLVNNEWFKRLSLGMTGLEAVDYSVEVITITPEELNDVSTPEKAEYISKLIKNADMFYINANLNHNLSYLMLYEMYNLVGKNQPLSEKYYNTTKDQAANLNFALHDINWDNVNLIFKRVAGIGCNKAAMIFDSYFYKEATDPATAYATLWRSVNGTGATMCNMAKLYIMLYQRNTVDFYNAFMQTEDPSIATRLITRQSTAVNRTGATGSFVQPDRNDAATSDRAMYWNSNTFLPFSLNSNGDMVKLATTAYTANGIVNSNMSDGLHDLTNNILEIYNKGIFTIDFIAPIALPADAQEAAVIHLSSLNKDGTIVSASSFTPAKLINVITNNGTIFDNTGGVAYPGGGDVEGVPSTSPDDAEDDIMDDGTDGSGLRGYKRILNIQPTADFNSSETSIRTILSSYDLQIVNMTSTQFNGCIEDINAKYDMIFMGSGFRRFNLNTGSTATVFNNTTLNGYLYLLDGDRRAIKTTYGKQTENYLANDLTVQKVKELKGYLSAGYPVVLDNGLYNRTGVISTTNLYRFISTYRGNLLNFLNLADYSGTTTARIAFMSKCKQALNVNRPIIDIINPAVPEGPNTNYVYVNPATNLLTINFKLLPKGVIPSNYTYDAKLYLDDNADGIFDATELLEVDSGDGLGIRESSKQTYTYSSDMAGMNGVYQWKLEIERTDNQEIRSTVTGYVANQSKQNIYILQIMENGTAYNLENKVNDAASLIHTYAGPSLKDYNLIFDTKTVSELVQSFVPPNQYTTATAATSNKLSKYHMIIFDTPTDSLITTTNGVLTNIKDEIASRNLVVLYTRNALTFNNQAKYYGTSSYSFLDRLTYNELNRNADIKNNNRLYIYNSLESNGTLTADLTFRTTYLTKTNEGTITRYPYQINKAIETAPNSFGDFAVIDFIEDTIVETVPARTTPKSRMIGWYSLSDSKSPIVRNVGLAGGATADLNKGLYSSSPNDVKNNYYLFSYNRCYYSGIKLSTADVAGNDDEIRLFVNTIIAAFKSTTRIISSPPVITITNPVPLEGLPKEESDTYYIRNVHSGLLMEVASASTADLALIQQNSNTNNNHMKFKIVSAGNGYFYIMTGSSGYTKAVDVFANNTANGTDIIQWTFHGATNQQFEIVEVSPGKYAIKTRLTSSASCLDNYNLSTSVGTPIKQRQYTGADNQLWYLETTSEDVINVTNSNIKDGFFNLTFGISGSSSNTDMTIKLNSTESTGSWDDTIYKLTGTTIGPAIAIENTNKVVRNGAYILKIPLNYVITNNVLIFTVINGEGNKTTKKVRMIYVQKPVVAIEDLELITNTITSKGYLYMDIDFNAVDTDEDYLDTAQDLEVAFSVDQSASDYTLEIASEGEDLTDGTGYDVTVTDEAGNVVDLTQACTGGMKKEYTMHIPVALMKAHNSREIVIKAIDTSGNEGEASVTLIRRSLFPLD